MNTTDKSPTPTLTTIAAEVGLTKSAVSLALRHDPRIPEGTRRRVEEAAERLGYRRNATVARLMSELRRGKPGGGGGIALLNLNDAADAFRSHPTIPSYVSGCRKRAGMLGYTLDEIHEPVAAMDGRRLLGILQARGHIGCILVGLMRSNRLPSGLAPVWKRMPCVVTGVRTDGPQIPFACADHHAATQLAIEMALAAGRKRPALVLDRSIDELVQGRFTAGFLIGQRVLEAGDRVPPFYHDDPGAKCPASFATWWRRHRPDAIITLYHVVGEWLRSLEVKVPGECALIQLEARSTRPDWAGVDQHNDETGAAAVDLLVQMIHAGETALTASPRAMLIEPNWRPGPTLPLPGKRKKPKPRDKESSTSDSSWRGSRRPT
jgi:LacI family transcriptional regulator